MSDSKLYEGTCVVYSAVRRINGISVAVTIFFTIQPHHVKLAECACTCDALCVGRRSWSGHSLETNNLMVCLWYVSLTI